jgi:hypothetical protein
MNSKILITLFLGYLLLSGNCFAESKVNKAVEGSEQNKSVEKKRRRKKVEICHECGKPETDCDCEGHGANQEKE